MYLRTSSYTKVRAFTTLIKECMNFDTKTNF